MITTRFTCTAMAAETLTETQGSCLCQQVKHLQQPIASQQAWCVPHCRRRAILGHARQCVEGELRAVTGAGQCTLFAKMAVLMRKTFKAGQHTGVAGDRGESIEADMVEARLCASPAGTPGVGKKGRTWLYRWYSRPTRKRDM